MRTACKVRVFSLNHLTPTEQRMVVTGADPARRVVHQINAEPAAQEYARLLGKEDPGVPEFDVPSVIVAHDLAPAETATLNPSMVRAIITEAGGRTSHTATLLGDGRVLVGLVGRVVEQCHAHDDQLAHVARQLGLLADGRQVVQPALGHRGAVQQHLVQVQDAAALGGDALGQRARGGAGAVGVGDTGHGIRSFVLGSGC